MNRKIRGWRAWILVGLAGLGSLPLLLRGVVIVAGFLFVFATAISVAAIRALIVFAIASLGRAVVWLRRGSTPQTALIYDDPEEEPESTPPHLRPLDRATVTRLADEAERLAPDSYSVRLETDAFRRSRTPRDAGRLARALWSYPAAENVIAELKQLAGTK